VKRSDIPGYLEAIPPGTNRRSHYKTLRKLWRWAFDLGHVENDPMVRLKPLDAWGVNNEVLSVELFQRFLRITQGLAERKFGKNCKLLAERGIKSRDGLAFLDSIALLLARRTSRPL
jgi:hypothetical protein